ncbi:MAG: carboxymuconolactone decarboxylase, partial [Saprospiraceae bacterium]
TSHAAIVSHLPEFGDDVISAVRNDYRSAPISDKLKALLNIAEKVRVSGRNVSESDIEKARQQGASDLDIHDTVLIAAMFCMMNRYVDGLGATTPDDPAFYAIVGKQRAEEGYMTKSVLVKD